MVSFNGNNSEKRSLIQRARYVGERSLHKDRSTLYWSRRAWCQAGYKCGNGDDCDHRFYADQVSVPVAVAYAERAIWLSLPHHEAIDWPVRFLRALPVGLDQAAFDKAWKRFALQLLNHPRHGLIAHTDTPAQQDAVLGVADLFEENSPCLGAWEKARAACRRADVDRSTNRPTAPEARAKAGSMAAMVAGHLAATFSDQRQIATAISWFGWPSRYTRHAELIAPFDNKGPKADSNGMVNLGAAMWALGEWRQHASEAESEGDQARLLTNEWCAQQFLKAMRDASPRTGIARVLDYMPGWRMAA